MYAHENITPDEALDKMKKEFLSGKSAKKEKILN